MANKKNNGSSSKDNLQAKATKHEQRLIDESIEESFPASDSPAWSEVSRAPELHEKSAVSKKFQIKKKLKVNGSEYDYYSLPAAEEAGLKNISQLPVTLKIFLENLLRHQDEVTVTQNDIEAMSRWLETKTSHHEIAYRPARVLMQDFTGVPAIVDLAAMRDAIKTLKGSPDRINPLLPVDLVIDHSIQVDEFNSKNAVQVNTKFEIERNYERYEFLRWGQKSFENFRVVPPATGICHQVNLEFLAKVVWTEEVNGKKTVFPDTLIGTDSHTTMINGLGVLGWGVGGIEAEAAMLGQPVSITIPEVVGVKLTGKLREGVTATDLVLTITQMLRKKGVVGKFVEYYGAGLHTLPLADRATIGNMSPEYGATCGFFPVDEITLDYLRLTGRDDETISLVEAYCKAQGIWHDKNTKDPVFTDYLELDLGSIEPCVAGPKRPQDKVPLAEIPTTFDKFLAESNRTGEKDKEFKTSENYDIKHGDVVIAAITSCTNTSNPSILMAAGLLAKKAVEKGLHVKPWVKTSFAPGSQVVTEYLQKAGLQKHLDTLGFSLVGYGCTTCIGNSGPLPEPVAEVVNKNDLVVSAILSGNRNFEGRIHPQVKANWLASPPLVVAFAIAGTTSIDITTQSLGKDKEGKEVYLKDLWPSNSEIEKAVSIIDSDMFRKKYSDVFKGDENWQGMKVSDNKTYVWQKDSTYIQHPTFFENMPLCPESVKDIKKARILALLGDSVTTDHISPAGSIKKDSPAGKYLLSKGVEYADFNSYGSRRGNHEVMVRGTFANIRLRNEMVPETEGGFTKHFPSNKAGTIFDVAMQYKAEGVPLVVFAGKEYGTGSSRDWAAKGSKLLGIHAVIAESFERIHRSNLIGMGILPLEFIGGMTRQSLKLTGDEIINIEGLQGKIEPLMHLDLTIIRSDGKKETIKVCCRLDTVTEVEYYKNGGILNYVLREML